MWWYSKLRFHSLFLGFWSIFGVLSLYWGSDPIFGVPSLFWGVPSLYVGFRPYLWCSVPICGVPSLCWGSGPICGVPSMFMGFRPFFLFLPYLWGSVPICLVPSLFMVFRPFFLVPSLFLCLSLYWWFSVSINDVSICFWEILRYISDTLPPQMSLCLYSSSWCSIPTTVPFQRKYRSLKTLPLFS